MSCPPNVILYSWLVKRVNVVVMYLHNAGKNEMIGKISAAIVNLIKIKEKGDAIQADKKKLEKEVTDLLNQKKCMEKEVLQTETELREVLASLRDAPSTMRGENDDLIQEIISHLEKVRVANS